jgi:hypothetical protein
LLWLGQPPGQQWQCLSEAEQSGRQVRRLERAPGEEANEVKKKRTTSEGKKSIKVNKGAEEQE